MDAPDAAAVSHGGLAFQQQLRSQRLPFLSLILLVTYCVASQIAESRDLTQWFAPGLSKRALERYRRHISWPSGAPGSGSLPSAHSTAKFSCFDGSRTIPLLFLNDDYCDCADGSDEPSTSACATSTQAASADGPDSLFWCLNTGFRPQGIPRWQLRDGVCDCCDGSDESLVPLTDTPIGSSKCPNTCLELGKALKAQQAERRAAYRKGRNKQISLVKESKLLQQEWKATQEELRNSVLPSLQKKIEAIQHRLERARKAQEDAARKSIGTPSVADDTQDTVVDAPGKTTEPDTTKHPDTDATVSTDGLKRAVPSLGPSDGSASAADPSVMISESKTTVISEYAQWMEKGEGSVTPAPQVSVSSPAAETDEVTSEDNAGVKDSDHETEVDSTAQAETSVRSAKRVEPTTKNGYLTAYGMRLKGHVRGYVQRALRAVSKNIPLAYIPSWLSDFLFSETDFQAAIVSLERQLGHLESEKSTHQSKLDDVEANLRLAEGAVANVPALLPLFKKCFATTVDKYRYEVCLLTNAAQKMSGEQHSTISLGTFKTLEVILPEVPVLPVQNSDSDGYAILHYENGTPCWNGPNRSIAVYLRCGSQTRLTEVIETERCVYKAQMTSPAVCAPGLVSSTGKGDPAFSDVAGEHDEL